MSTADLPAAPGAGRGQRHRRGRGRARGGRAATLETHPITGPPQPLRASLAIRPASVAPSPDTSGTPVSANTSNSNRGRGPGRRGFNRGGQRGHGGAPQQHLVNGQRAFGGQLTASSVPSSISGSLAGDAPEFVPGQPMAPRRGKQSHGPRARRMSKSQAPDIATRTHEDITNGQYECVICTNEVLPNSKIWTCKTCWASLTSDLQWSR